MNGALVCICTICVHVRLYVYMNSDKTSYALYCHPQIYYKGASNKNSIVGYKKSATETAPTLLN